MEGEHHHDERAPWGRNPMVYGFPLIELAFLSL